MKSRTDEHMKRILRLDRFRLRGLSGVRDDVLLTATAQNLRRLAKLLCRAPLADKCCSFSEEQRMKNMQESLDKLRADAAKFAMMSVLEPTQKSENISRDWPTIRRRASQGLRRDH